MAVAWNGVVLRVNLVELPHALRDDTNLDAVASTNGQRLLDGFELAKLRKLIKHQQQPLLLRLLALLFRVKLHVAHKL